MKPHKYGAVPTEVDGIRFASKKEAKRYSELKLLERAGEIHSLRLQPVFPLCAHEPDRAEPPVIIGEYRADFAYCECGRKDKCEQTRVVVEDVKGFKTPLYKWKKRHAEAEHHMRIREV